MGEFYKSCEKMTAGNNWDKTNTIDMINTRAFHSMVATEAGIFAFGGEEKSIRVGIKLWAVCRL